MGVGDLDSTEHAALDAFNLGLAFQYRNIEGDSLMSCHQDIWNLLSTVLRLVLRVSPRHFMHKPDDDAMSSAGRCNV